MKDSTYRATSSSRPVTAANIDAAADIFAERLGKLTRREAKFVNRDSLITNQSNEICIALYRVTLARFDKPSGKYTYTQRAFAVYIAPSAK